jgi:hypothetical protein
VGKFLIDRTDCAPVLVFFFGGVLNSCQIPFYFSSLGRRSHIIVEANGREGFDGPVVI